MLHREQTLPDVSLPIERQLFEVVRLVCLRERGVSMEYLEERKVADWRAPDGSGIAIRHAELSLPLRHINFGVKNATLVAGDKNSAFSVRVDTSAVDERRVPDDCIPFEYDYQHDPIAVEVLEMFKSFLAGHVHGVCVEQYRERKGQRRAKEAAALVQERREAAAEDAAAVMGHMTSAEQRVA